MTALVELERGYAFQTLVAAARLEHTEPDERDVEPDAPEPGGDPGPMPTPINHAEKHVQNARRLWIDTTGQPVITTTPNGVKNATRWGWTEAKAVPLTHDTEERERIAKAIEDLPTTWPNGVKHSAAWMRLEAADVARRGADA
ncbi:hypothetical protein AB0O99_04120 [Cellulosimicrobium funkei]|uniref:hypothetical protein n=1 Tax=Cellulosimicrobium funkei TaxID=264251 RepID=UPI00341E1D83